MGDKEVLKYMDVVLRDSDLDTLRGPCFLNDQIIAFYFSYLFSSSKSDDILLVKPSISVFLAKCEDDKSVEEFAQSCRLSSKRLVLFAINDNDDYGGSHWSILVYDRTKNSFLHYDCMEGVNNFHAMKLYDAVKEFMGPGGESVSKPLGAAKPESVAVTTPAVFIECKTPQQSNGYDCGLYVLAIARAICQRCSHGNNKGDVISVIEKHVDDSVEINMRSEDEAPV
uniref:Ubiquitin-like protease family profile domain-containing protein n=1 Tax=Chenopodium quinoa TaxID=63459 RepID=A0A803KVQ7_CHEQI